MEKSISRLIADMNSSSYKQIDNYQVCLQLKYILDKDISLSEFAKWFMFVDNTLKSYSKNFYDFFIRINFLKTNDEYCTKFFHYCNSIRKINDSVERLFQMNSIGPVAFVTPELGRWSTVGGLGVMVDELSKGLVHIGQDVLVISPYYEKNKKGETGYLSKDPANFEHVFNIEVTLDKKYTFGVHFGTVDGVKLYFLHNYEIFPTAYAEGNNSFVLKQICIMGKASLELLCHLNLVPAVVVTNDWSTGLTAAYSKYGHFGDTFAGTTFFHIVHNLEPTYEGRIYPNTSEGTLEYIHRLPNDVLIEPEWKSKIINRSRAAIIKSDNWGTVSPTYRMDLCRSSPLAKYLNMHPKPFAYPNGIFKKDRIRILKEKCGENYSHEHAKEILQKKYFKFEHCDPNTPLLSFIGRITEQKGVKLILEAAETIINKYNGKINILVGGMGNPKDKYCIECISYINYLRDKYPYSFWANPYEFFTDGPVVNLGSDFALMPSVFEPGGIVQHEFFIAGTPVIAFRTGGLKDTVNEFDWSSDKGNGILFEVICINLESSF
jgi:starch synthase